MRVAVPNSSTIYIQDYAFETDERPIHIPKEVPEPPACWSFAAVAIPKLAVRDFDGLGFQQCRYQRFVRVP